jgi:membrane-bound lytic murein transglycosylase B
MKKNLFLAFLFFAVLFCNLNNFAVAYNANDFQNFVNSVKQNAANNGISQATLNSAFKNVEYLPRVVELDNKQPERAKDPGFQKYKRNVINNARLERARKELIEHYFLLDDIEKKFGVGKEYIVALWAVETNFGDNKGNFYLINSLTSLAYEGRRRDFFLDQLLKALQILDEGHIGIEKFKGSWAGAFGQFQFMPSTFLKYAYDYDGDGKRDLWNNKADGFASAANYLKSIGWEYNLNWGKRVIAPARLNNKFIDRNFSQNMYKWRALGLRYADGQHFFGSNINASLIDPDGVEGDRSELYIVTDNFKRLFDWNRSSYFVVSIGLIADYLRVDR